MEDRELYKAIESLARQAKKSGQAKSRKSHLFVSMMLFLILASMAMDKESAFYYKVKDAYAELEQELGSY
jgi:hypothetical protein